MADEAKNLITLPDNHALEIPSFGKSPALVLEMEKIRGAEHRIIEAKNVNPSTYAELEHVYNEAYRDLKRHLSTVGYNLAMAKKSMEEAKADVLMGTYADYLQGKPKYQDNANIREAFITRDPVYTAAYERVAQLEAIISSFEGRVKMLENVCRYMRKKMDLVLRETNGNVYPTHGR